jgi:hypothetical protein
MNESPYWGIFGDFRSCQILGTGVLNNCNRIELHLTFRLVLHSTHCPLFDTKMSGSPTVWFVDRSQIHDLRDSRGLTDAEAPSRLRSYKSAECEEALSKLGLTEREDAIVQRANRRGRIRSYQPQHSVVFPKDSEEVKTSEMPTPQHSPGFVSQVDGWGSPMSARKVHLSMHVDLHCIFILDIQ